MTAKMWMPAADGQRDCDTVYVYQGILSNSEKNRVLSLAPAEMELELVILGAVNQAQETRANIMRGYDSSSFLHVTESF